MEKHAVPAYVKMIPYTLQALGELGGKASIRDIDRRVVDLMGIPDDVVSLPHNETGKTEVAYRISWARTDLKRIGFIDNLEQGVWILTDKGFASLGSDPSDIMAQVYAKRAEIRSRREAAHRNNAVESAGGQSAKASVEPAAILSVDAEAGQDSHLPQNSNLELSEESDEDEPRYIEKAYFVGAMIDGIDMTDEFVAQGQWRCGYDAKYADQINAIEPGDLIAIKAAYTRKNGLPFDNHGEPVSVMKIKARGVVRFNPHDGVSLRVDWEPGYQVREEWLFFTLRSSFSCIRQDALDWKRGALLEFTFGDDVQDIDGFLSDPYWAGRYVGVSEGDDAEPLDDERDDREVARYGRDDFLADVFMDSADYERLVAILKRKGNVILQGPPGTGKTYAAKRLAWSIMGKKDEDAIAFVQFHQSTSYEDLIVGYRPTDNGGFKLKDGIFTKLCVKAAHPSNAKRSFFFIIDEINRANVSKVMGEMLMTMEMKHRGEMVDVRMEGGRNGFSVPPNVFVIGMMNTADRSIASIDYALRRRFSFFPLEPAFGKAEFLQKLSQLVPADLARGIVDAAGALNDRIAEERGSGLRIGHSYFLDIPESEAPLSEEAARSWLRDVVECDIVPLMEEYYYGAAPGTIASYVQPLRLLAGERREP